MSTKKQFQLEGIGTVSIYKNRLSRSIRLSIKPDGEVRVSQPSWLPYKAGLTFVATRKRWIIDNKPAPNNGFTEGQLVGKSYAIHFEHGAIDKPRSSRRGHKIVLTLPYAMTSDEEAAQATCQSACLRALRADAELLLPGRLARLAEQHGFDYQTLNFRDLKSRWGSCSSKQEITLNIFLMELPWQLIDYVLLHELTHTRAMHHGKDFWDILLSISPNARLLRAEIKRYRPTFQHNQVYN